ncbi:3-ketoacyl-CoA synthase [Pseudoscourfieldia marina]
MSAAPAPEVHPNGAAGSPSGGMGFRVGSYTRLDEQHPPSFIKGYLAVLEDVVSPLRVPIYATAIAAGIVAVVAATQALGGEAPTNAVPMTLRLLAAVANDAAVWAQRLAKGVEDNGGIVAAVKAHPQLTAVVLVVLAILRRLMSARGRRARVFLVDFEVTDMHARPGDDKAVYAASKLVGQCSNKRFVQSILASQVFDEGAINFQVKVSERSGLGDDTFLPRCLFLSDEAANEYDRNPSESPEFTPSQSIDKAREEFLHLVVPTCRKLLARYAAQKFPARFVSTTHSGDASGGAPKALDGVPDVPLIGAIVTNCSLFTPTPSLSAMLLNALQLPNGAHVRTYSLGGMGCSAGLIALDLADQLLQAATQRGEVLRVLVVSTENITQNLFYGNERCMLLPNALFRCGAACILMSNEPPTTAAGAAYGAARALLRIAAACTGTAAAGAAHLVSGGSRVTARALLGARSLFLPSRGPSDSALALYELRHAVVRTNLAADDKAYRCVWQGEDGDGNLGIRLEKNLMAAAGKAMSRNITELGPLVLPWSEQIRYLISLVLLWNEKRRRRSQLKKKAAVGEDSATAHAPTKEEKKVAVPDFTTAFRHFCIHCGGRGVLDEVEKQLKLSEGTMAASRLTLKSFGNTSSSSVWYSLACHESGVAASGPSGDGRGIRRGDVIWQLGFGSGFKANSAVWVARRDVRRLHSAWSEVAQQ